MGNLQFKDKLAVTCCWVASFWFLGAGWYDFFNSQSSISNLAISTGVAITLFSAGLIPKLFFMPFKSAFTEIQSPILVNAETQVYLTLGGIVISSIGLGVQLLT
ncbi:MULTISPECIES: hypothetical protein [unclassified Shewanella]|uniref:hypothetical protein n=1 Tax=unclassified Shewanella TaxID=196818 RepID=UPI001BC73A1D|nr:MULTISPECIES: hypothetical protein [unclassified Shewanella]GIU05843.1 hypothetical protein TUM4444_02840 [Shewanella sp. MBTL60-112-B1]GIU25760.1 hypothetical protein TUM4445_04280 [Shewanella sp. MBTL60-112-B2]